MTDPEAFFDAVIDRYPVDVWPDAEFSDAQAATVLRLMLPRIRAEAVEHFAALTTQLQEARGAGKAIVGAWDAMDAVPSDDPRPTQQLADEFAAKLMPMRALLDAEVAALARLRESTNAD